MIHLHRDCIASAEVLTCIDFSVHPGNTHKQGLFALMPFAYFHDSAYCPIMPFPFSAQIQVAVRCSVWAELPLDVARALKRATNHQGYLKDQRNKSQIRRRSCRVSYFSTQSPWQHAVAAWLLKTSGEQRFVKYTENIDLLAGM